jgi:hypothetical protein
MHLLLLQYTVCAVGDRVAAGLFSYTDLHTLTMRFRSYKRYQVGMQSPAYPANRLPL